MRSSLTDERIEVNKMPLHRSELYLSILQLYREIINRYTVIVLLQRELNFMLSENKRTSMQLRLLQSLSLSIK